MEILLSGAKEPHGGSSGEKITNVYIECKDSYLNSKDHPGILVVDYSGIHVKYL